MGENKNKSETPGFKLLVNCYAKPNPSFLRTYLDLFIFFTYRYFLFKTHKFMLVYLCFSAVACLPLTDIALLVQPREFF